MIQCKNDNIAMVEVVVYIAITFAIVYSDGYTYKCGYGEIYNIYMELGWVLIG